MRRSIWLVAGRFGLLQKFSANAGVFEAWERSFLQEGDESKLQACFGRWKRSFSSLPSCTCIVACGK